MDRGLVYRAIDTVNVRLGEIGGHPVTLTTVIAVALIVVFTFAASVLLQRGIKRALGKNVASVYVASRLSHYVVLFIGLSIALETAGIDLHALFTAGALFAVGIGFAMQNVAQNFVSGVILLIEHSIRPDDVLDIEGKQVRVVEMGIRSTRVRSRDDEILIVPNSTLVQSTVRSYTLLDTLCRVRTTVGVAYDNDMKKVRAALEGAGQNTPIRSQGRDALVLLTDFGASSVEWEVSIWIEDPWQLRPSQSALRESIWESLKEAGVQIPFPQMDVHLDEHVVKAIGSRSAAA